MVFKSLKYLFVACIVAVSLNVHAFPTGIVDNDTYTTDENTGLDWLDLSFTAGLSYNDAASAVGDIEGGNWVYATQAQVYEMFYKMFPGWSEDPYTDPAGYADEITDFVDLYGSSNAEEHEVLAAIGLVRIEMTQRADLVGVTITNCCGDAISGPSGEAGSLDVDTQDPMLATWLVRNSASAVPEPPIMLLLCSGLLGIFGVIRLKAHK